MDSFLIAKDIDHFLREDLAFGDTTTEAIFGPADKAIAFFIAKCEFVSAGMELVAAEVFRRKNPSCRCQFAAADGTRCRPGDIVFKVAGPTGDLLIAERTALNLVQRLSGIATLTAHFVEKVADFPVRVTDTRKTTPGLRLLEKYAVRVGGGFNHRFCLSDGILIKDNHIAACGSIEKAVQKVRSRAPHAIKIEVETTTLDEVRQCLACGVEIIMLDNMSLELMQEAVRIVNHRALVEASGGVNLGSIRDIAATGVDIISIGALTHSAPASDISMRLKTD
ncbi:MAG: carboxylating nicotinate-nucleotide diphosphorylase [Deltaproteobacteria bacterium]